MGTSFTGQYTWMIGKPVGFAWQVQLHLENTEVQNQALAGFGSFAPMRQFLGKKDPILREFETCGNGEPPGKKVVIWEFPVRDLFNILAD